jgi:peptidoglycan DL-endopeptidase CwlO
VLHGRKRLGTAFAALAGIATITLVPPTPASADPDIDDVKERVDRLYHEAEQATERHHDLELELKDLRQDLSSLEADERRQDKRLEDVRVRVEDSLVEQYQGGTLSSVGEVVVSENPDEFLADLSTVSSYNDLQSGMYDEYTTELEALDIRRDAVEDRTEEIEDAEADAAKEKQAADDKLEEAQDLLDTLEAEERDRLDEASRSGSTTRLPAGDASGRAAAAINYARAQVGDSYVYGAAGPDAFDCSGLTMMAWAQAGVGLPHSSGAQMGSGPSVPSSQLQPGDLVFYYSPVSHVGIYIGDGLIVHAANPSTGVVVAGVMSMPFSGAVRPG